MLENLAVLALISFFSFGSHAPTLPAPPLAENIVSPLPLTQVTSTPTQTPTPSPTETPTPTMTPMPTPTATPTILPTQTPTPTPQVTAVSATDVDGFFTKYASEYSVDQEVLKRIARCESGFNTNAEYGDYIGMFQYASQSWTTVRSEMGLDTNPDLRKNAEEAIKTAAFHVSRHGAGAWPNC